MLKPKNTIHVFDSRICFRHETAAATLFVEPFLATVTTVAAEAIIYTPHQETKLSTPAICCAE